jgi:molybdenum cofactor cytidylyltransferase
MVVVVGHEADAVEAALSGREFRSFHVDRTEEMIASIKVGMIAARVLYPTADLLLQPADHAEVRRETLDVLIETAAENPNRAVMPEYQGKGGHPVLVPAQLAAHIISYAGSGGLRQFWLDHADRCMRLAVDDPGVVFDVDTPLDYDLGVQ